MVDFTTIFLVISVALGTSGKLVNDGSVIITYNIIAFAGQLPIGILADAIGKTRSVAAIGCALSAIAYPLSLISPLSACVCAALGNGAFHIGGGGEILEISMPKAGLSGLFVSSGALGVWLAHISDGGIIGFVCPLLLFIACIFLFVTDSKSHKEEPSDSIRFSLPDFLSLSAVSLFLLTIVIRSLIGAITDFPWKTTPLLSFVLVAAVVFGKAAGGYLGDKFGYIKVAVISLLTSLVTFVFAFDLPMCGVIAVLCFNMTMPLTLTAIAGASGKKYGFAFGLTTFALAIGYIPTVFGVNRYFGIPLLVAGVLLSLIMITAGYLLLRKKSKGVNL